MTRRPPTIPPALKATVFTMAVVLTAAGGGSGIGAAVTSFTSGPSQRSILEVRDELVQLRIDTRKANDELNARIGKLEQALDARDSNQRSNGDAARSYLRKSRDPDAARALRLLDE